jgi:hydroxymethylbilane synthase
MAASSPPVLRLGTRGSLLARTQSQLVADELAQLHPGLRVELVTVRTTGDRITDRPLYDVGGKGLFTKELEQALLAGEVDFAVHSFKDVPVTMPLVDTSDLVIAAVPKREDPRDVVVMRDPSKGVLPAGAKAGTSSLRRRAQLLELGSDLTILPLRGNIDTRLRKVREGEYDVIVLAMAGLLRAGLYDAGVMKPLDVESMLPAPAQGALALQCRRDDAPTRDVLAALNNSDTAACVAAERAVVAALNGDCHSPIAALATIDGESRGMLLRAAVAGRDGEPPVLRASAQGPAREADALVAKVVKLLFSCGATPGQAPSV